MRRPGPAVALALLVVAAGCLGPVAGDPTYEASPATLDDAVREARGFAVADSGPQPVAATVALPLVGERTVTLRNRHAQYERRSGDGTALLVVVATPRVEVAGRPASPFRAADPRDLVERFGEGPAQHRNLSRAGTSHVAMLGTDARVAHFTATTERDGPTTSTDVYVAVAAHEGDYVVAVVVLPASMDGQPAAVAALFGGIEH